MAKIVFRLGAVIPLTENLDVGEPVWDADKAAFGVGNGERNPRFYPGIRSDSSLKLNGPKIISPNSDNNYVLWSTTGYSIFWNSKEAFRVDSKGVTVISNFTTGGQTIVGNLNVPPGGLTGQVLMKLSNRDFDVGWVNVDQSGGNNGGGSSPDEVDGGVFTASGSSGGSGSNLDGGVFS